MSKNNAPNDARSPGGLILPPNADIVQVRPTKYAIGGLIVEAPDDPSVVMQITPTLLRDPALMMGFLGAVMNSINALTREVNRLRANAELPPWGAGGTNPDAPAEDTNARVLSAPAHAPCRRGGLSRRFRLPLPATSFVHWPRSRLT